MKNNFYESPRITFLIPDDVILVSSVLDGDDIGIRYGLIFGDEGGLYEKYYK